MITLAKRGDAHARSQAQGYVYDNALVDRMFELAPDRFGDRNGGYCRVIKQLTPRRGDNAEMAVLQFVDYQPDVPEDDAADGEGEKKEGDKKK